MTPANSGGENVNQQEKEKIVEITHHLLNLNNKTFFLARGEYMGIKVITRTVATCDIPGCKISDTIEGAFPDRIPEGWMKDVANVELVCHIHAKAVRAILVGKKGRGPDKKPRQKESQQMASAPEQVESTITTVANDPSLKGRPSRTAALRVALNNIPTVDEITPERARKGKGDPIGNAAKITPQQAAASRVKQHLDCPFCPAHLKQTCVLDGVAAIDCFDAQSKKTTEG